MWEDERDEGDGPAWVPDGWDLPEHERSGDASTSVRTLDERLRSCGKHAHAYWEALGSGPMTQTALISACGLKPGNGAYGPLIKMAKAGLVRQDADGRWERSA